MAPQATSSKNWRKRTGGNALELPSGNVCLVKRPGMEKLLQAGIMPDSLTPIAMKQLQRAESGGRPVKEDDEDLDQELMSKIMEDPAEMAEIFYSFDRVTAMCVVEPKVLLHIRERRDENGRVLTNAKGKVEWEDIPDEARLSDEHDETLADGTPNPLYAADPPLYTDEVDSEDKQVIFEYVVGGGNGQALGDFREPSGAAVADAQPREDVSLPAE